MRQHAGSPIRTTLRVACALAAATLASGSAPARAHAAWSSPAVLAGPLVPALRHQFVDRAPVAAVNRRGQWIVAWTRGAVRPVGVTAALGTPRGALGGRAVVSRTGVLWAAAIADDGTAIVLVSERPGGVWAAIRPPGGRFGPPRLISGPLRGSVEPTAIAFDRAGNALVAWSRFVRAGHAHSWRIEVVERPAGGRFGPVATLGAGVAPHVAFNLRGDAVVAWTSVVESGGIFPVPFTRTSIAQAVVRPAGGAFGAIVTLSSSPAYAASGAIGTNGGVGVAWEHANGPESDPYGPIQTAALTPAGTFDGPVDAPTVRPTRAFGPAVFSGAQDELVVLWQEKARVTPFSRAAPVYWALRTAGLPFGPRRTLTAAEVTAPLVAATGDGRALAVWTDSAFRAALYRSGAGFVPVAAPGGRPAPIVTTRLVAAGDFAVLVWQTPSHRLLASVRRAIAT